MTVSANSVVTGVPVSPFVTNDRVTTNARLTGIPTNADNLRSLTVSTNVAVTNRPTIGQKTLWLPGSSGNYVNTPDSAALDIVGDIQIDALIAPDVFPPAGTVGIAAKDTTTGNQRSWQFTMTSTGTLRFVHSADGAATTFSDSTAAVSLSSKAWKWVRVVLDCDNGAAGHDKKFYTSPDGVTWTQLGTTVTTAGVTSVFNSNADLEVGAHNAGGTPAWLGKIQRVKVYDGIGGTLVADFDPERSAETYANGATFTASTGEVWTLNSTGSTPAHIF